MNVAADHPLAVAVIHAIREGEVSSLKRLLEEPPGLASARITDPKTNNRISRPSTR